MSRWHSYHNSAVQILADYSGEEPFSSFLKKFFAVNKKFGSKDRKLVSHLCYCFFRLGKAWPNLTVEDRIVRGLFLCSGEPNPLLENLAPALNEKTNLSIDEKLILFDYPAGGALFPWKMALSLPVDAGVFEQSFFIQPDLFLRIRPGQKAAVIKKLEAAGTSFQQLTDTCIALANTSKIDSILALDKEAVIQDYSSQRIEEFLTAIKPIGHEPLTVWDCCAASGGKSLLANDVLGNIDLTVSDVRESIISNLKKRFAEAGITKYKSFMADLLGRNFKAPGSFDLIIADVPCTGSGTWSRTPEQLYYFNEKRINEYADLQRKIVSVAINCLQPGGYFLYITCSVFRQENEEMVDFILQQTKATVIKIETLKGYDKKADTMFAALLQKSL